MASLPMASAIMAAKPHAVMRQATASIAVISFIVLISLCAACHHQGSLGQELPTRGATLRFGLEV